MYKNLLQMPPKKKHPLSPNVLITKTSPSKSTTPILDLPIEDEQKQKETHTESPKHEEKSIGGSEEDNDDGFLEALKRCGLS